MKNLWKKFVAKSRGEQPVRDTAQARLLMSLGRTSQHLQGVDGRYSDNDSGRSYYK